MKKGTALCTLCNKWVEPSGVVDSPDDSLAWRQHKAGQEHRARYASRCLVRAGYEPSSGDIDRLFEVTKRAGILPRLRKTGWGSTRMAYWWPRWVVQVVRAWDGSARPWMCDQALHVLAHDRRARAALAAALAMATPDGVDGPLVTRAWVTAYLRGREPGLMAYTRRQYEPLQRGTR